MIRTLIRTLQVSALALSTVFADAVFETTKLIKPNQSRCPFFKAILVVFAVLSTNLTNKRSVLASV
jgi:hypothetical protein